MTVSIKLLCFFTFINQLKSIYYYKRASVCLRGGCTRQFIWKHASYFSFLQQKISIYETNCLTGVTLANFLATCFGFEVKGTFQHLMPQNVLKHVAGQM